MSAASVTKELSADPCAAGPTLSDFVRESGLRALVIGASKVPNAKITVMLVSSVDGVSRSELAVKVPTTDVAATAIEHEAAMLVSLDALALEMGSAIPRLVGQVDFHGRLGVVMTAVSGTPMATSYARGRHTADRVGADFAAVDRWLATLQGATAAGSVAVDLGAGIAERLSERFGEGDISEDLSRLAEIRRRLRTSLVPRTVVHGDMWLGNVLLTDGVASGVVDWEGAEPCGEPLRDVVRFAITYALFLDRHTRRGRRVRGHPELRAGTWGAGVEYALDGAGWFPDLVRGFLQDGLARLGADPALWRDAALAGIAEFAAVTDDPVFGRSVLELFRRVAR